jgi:hypothetical protein
MENPRDHWHAIRQKQRDRKKSILPPGYDTGIRADTARPPGPAQAFTVTRDSQSRGAVYEQERQEAQRKSATQRQERAPREEEGPDPMEQFYRDSAPTPLKQSLADTARKANIQTKKKGSK